MQFLLSDKNAELPAAQYGKYILPSVGEATVRQADCPNGPIYTRWCAKEDQLNLRRLASL